MEHLIPMTDFVLKQNYTTTLDMSQRDFYDKELSIFEKIRRYANFLKKPLKLGYFIPCDENDVPLEEPIFHEPNNESEIGNYQLLRDEFEEAKQRVLFEGFEYDYIGGVNFLTLNGDIYAFKDFKIKFKNLTVEFLIDKNIKLTETAKKEIGTK